MSEKKPAAVSTAKAAPGAAGSPYRIPDERYAAARVLYEATPGMTYDRLSVETGISARSLEERSRKGGWKKNVLLPPTGMSEAAQAVADTYVNNLAAYGDDVTGEQRETALKETAVETAVAMRATLIDRHRREWAAPRKLAYESMQKRDFELAKLAKINSETLRNIQDGERKAWGIEKDDDRPPIVIIERD